MDCWVCLDSLPNTIDGHGGNVTFAGSTAIHGKTVGDLFAPTSDYSLLE